ncbi:MAG: hypothetical protein LBI06_08520 [Treponema sp.]|nr:hypothetical protein [Treponema sp.]
MASIKVIPVYASMEGEITRHSGSIFQILAGKFLDTKLLAVHCCVLALVLYSFLSAILIYYFFEKTQSPEILFVLLFAISSSLEVLRFILPLGRVYEIPSLYLLISSRIILFGRFFGIFSLATASVYAAGLKIQKQRNVALIITVTTLIIVLGVPIDTQTWDSSLLMVNGYAAIFRLIEIGAFFVTTTSFFIVAWSRGSREFAFIGTGAALTFLGRNILLNAGTWAGLSGLLLLAIGTWLICTRLHKIYLWL